MDKKTEALKLALEALEYISSHYMSLPKIGCMALAAVEEALAEQPAQDEDQAHYKQVVDGVREAFDAKRKQQPYGWKVYGVNSLFMGEFAESDAKAEAKRIGGTCITFPLYTSPPASKPWIGLSDEEIEDLYFDSFSMGELKAFARAIEAKLKEKNHG